MTDRNLSQTPLICRVVIWVAARLAPMATRSNWHARWRSRIDGWWILAGRGEFPGPLGPQAAKLCLDAFADALWSRFTREEVRDWFRRPAFVLAVLLTALAITGALTGGFSYTRIFLDAVRDPAAAQMLKVPSLRATEADLMMTHSTAIGFALIVGLFTLSAGGRLLPGSGWRYWTFFAVKTACLAVMVTVVWLETGAVLRAHFGRYPQSLLLAGIVFALLFFGALGWALLWSLEDQRRRCHTCLRRMSLPVSVGSWSSVFDPPGTELLCDRGHGSLCVSEASNSGDDRWTPLDPSWEELFAGTRQ